MAHNARWCRVLLVEPVGAELVACELRGPGAADLGAIDVVAQLALVAQRRRARVVVTEASGALAELLRLSGLRVEVRRQPEGREEPLGSEEREEERHRRDLAT